MSNRTKQLIFGIALIVVGIGYFGEALHFWSFTIFFPGWWTLLLIIPAIVSIAQNGLHFGSLFLLLLGIYYFLDANGWNIFYINIPTLASLICICFGIHLLFHK